MAKCAPRARLHLSAVAATCSIFVLTITNLRKRYGGQTVLDGINWFVPDGARVSGLVGANGSGKSTLLRLIAGQVEPDDGSIVVPKDCTVGYLPQEVFGISGHTVLDHALGAFAEVRALEAECRRVEHELAEDSGGRSASRRADGAVHQAAQRMGCVRLLRHGGASGTGAGRARLSPR